MPPREDEDPLRGRRWVATVDLPHPADARNALTSGAGGRSPLTLVSTSAPVVALVVAAAASATTNQQRPSLRLHRSPFGRDAPVASAVSPDGHFAAHARGRQLVVTTCDDDLLDRQTHRLRYDVADVSIARLAPVATTPKPTASAVIATATPRGVQLLELTHPHEPHQANDNNNKPPTTLVHGFGVRLVEFSPDAESLLVVTDGGNVGVWSTRDALGGPRPAQWRTTIACALVSGAAFSADGCVLAVSTWEDAKPPAVHVFARQSLNPHYTPSTRFPSIVASTGLFSPSRTQGPPPGGPTNPALCAVSPCGSFVACAWRDSLVVVRHRLTTNANDEEDPITDVHLRLRNPRGAEWVGLVACAVGDTPHMAILDDQGHLSHVRWPSAPAALPKTLPNSGITATRAGLRIPHNDDFVMAGPLLDACELRSTSAWAIATLEARPNSRRVVGLHRPHTPPLTWELEWSPAEECEPHLSTTCDGTAILASIARRDGSNRRDLTVVLSGSAQ